MALTLREQTTAQFAGRFFRDLAAARGNKLELHRRVWVLLERIAAGDVTDAQARAAFNAEFGRSLTALQWTTFKTSKLQPMHDRYAQMMAEADL